MQDVLGRYQTLSDSNAHLMEERFKAENVIEVLGNEMEAYTKEQTSAMVTKTNAIGAQ